MITGGTQQIVTAYEDCGMLPEQIAESLEGEYDITAIKAVLMQFSGKYRMALKQAGADDKTIGFNEAQEEAAIQTIATIAQCAEDDHTRLRASMYIRDDRKGRLDVSSAMKGLGINVMQFQLILNQANKALELTDKKRSVDAIEVKAA